MKQKTNSFVLIVALLGFAAASWSANMLYGWKNSMTPYQDKVPTQFYAGMDKFLSNISWMTLIQWQAQDSQSSPTEVTDKLFDKLNALTNLDPLFADAYLDGALSLSASHPDQSLKLLDKALNMGLDNNWKVPFYAGQICVLSKGDLSRAVQYFEAAKSCPDAPIYVQSAELHAECLQVQEDPVASARIWYKYWRELSGPDAAFMQRAAADEVNGYGEQATTSIEQKLQSTTDSASRESLLHDRSEIGDMIKAVNAGAHAAPTTQPEIKA